jgi:hypothetical protein
MGLLVLLVVVGSAVWVGVDASGRDWSDNAFADATWKWVAGSLLLWIVAFPLYLVHRGRVPRHGEPSAPVGPRPSEVPATGVSVPPPSMRRVEDQPRP